MLFDYRILGIITGMGYWDTAVVTPFAQNCVSCNSRRKYHPDILKILFYINPRVPEAGGLLASRFDIVFTKKAWSHFYYGSRHSREDQTPVLAVHALTNVNSILSILRSVLYLLMAVSTSNPLAPAPPGGPHACSPTRGEKIGARDQWLAAQDRKIQTN